LKVTAETAIPCNVNWSVTPSEGVSLWGSENPTYFGFSQNRTYTVTATTTNACGNYSLSKNITISGITCMNCLPPSLYSMPLLETDSLVIVSGKKSSDASDLLFSIYPNPASSQVSIDLLDDVDILSLQSVSTLTYSIRIIDIYGNTVYKGEKQEKKFDLPVSSFRNGIYYVIVSNGINTGQGKLIVNH
jgi:PKD repeat protein